VNFRILSVTLLFIVFFTAACNAQTPTEEVKLPSLPTPDVPPLSEIDAAIERWENSDFTEYFIEADERNQDEQWMIRAVIADNMIRSAQRLDLGEDGNWGEPYSISKEEAESYRVESLFARIRNDASGGGASLYNMIAAFDDSFGYPLYTHAEALPSYTEEETLELNRQHSYDLAVEVKQLMENTYGADQEPIFTLMRNGGPEALCENLRVFPDGSSIFVDDCRNIFWQIPTPESRKVHLDEFRSSFGSLDELTTEDDQTQHLIILGTGTGTPDPDTLEEAWLLSTELHDLLSKPTGMGMVMSYTYDGNLLGYDLFNKITLPSQFPKHGDLRGAVLTPRGDRLAFSDDEGLKVFEIKSQSATQLLPPPEEGYYLPRSWSNTGQLFVSHYPEDENGQIRHGWLSLEDNAWRDLPMPVDALGYGCDTGAAWSFEGDELAITGLGYGEACNMNPGLSIIDLFSNTAQIVIASTMNTGEGESDTLTAGAHTPAWSPDGTWIAFGLDQDATEADNFPIRLYRAHPDGSNLTPLTNTSQGSATHPVWAQDGSLYYGLSDAAADQNGLYQYLPEDNTHILLLPGSGIHPLSISPDGEFLLYEQDRILRIWRIRLGETVAEITGEEDKRPSFSGWLFVESEQ
jgi:WD40 repeat protein